MRERTGADVDEREDDDASWVERERVVACPPRCDRPRTLRRTTDLSHAVHDGQGVARGSTTAWDRVPYGRGD